MNTFMVGGRRMRSGPSGWKYWDCLFIGQVGRYSIYIILAKKIPGMEVQILS